MAPSTEDDLHNHDTDESNLESSHTFQGFRQIVDNSPLAQLSAYQRLNYLRYLPQILDFQNNIRNIPSASIPPTTPMLATSNSGGSGHKPQFSDTKLVFKGYNFYKSWENFSKRMGGVKGQSKQRSSL